MNHTDCIYRSQLELGKLYTRLQKDQRAITCFEAALKCQSDPTEEVCFILFELAKAHHNVKNYSKAVLHGQKAVEISDGLFNPRMGVNSRVVLAQANGTFPIFTYLIALLYSCYPCIRKGHS